MAPASSDVVCERLAGRGVQRDQAGPAELGAAHCQHRSFEIDILKLKMTRFAQTEARDAQQAEQTIIGPWQQCAAFAAVRHFERGTQQVLDLPVRVQVRSRPFGLKGCVF